MAEELQTEIDTITDTIKRHMTATNADELNGAALHPGMKKAACLNALEKQKISSQ